MDEWIRPVFQYQMLSTYVFAEILFIHNFILSQKNIRKIIDFPSPLIVIYIKLDGVIWIAL